MRPRLVLLAAVLTSACSTAAPPATGPGATTEDRVGVLVMAHGGSPEWNASVDAAVGPLAADVPTVVAYGMADPHSLAAGLQALEERGVRRVAVVRMFLSGESFLDQTRYYLRLSDTPPERFLLMGHAMHDPAARTQLSVGPAVATHGDGILGSPEAARIMVDRARALSVDPAEEAVLLLAHGMGDEAENQRVLRAMDDIAARVSSEGFAEVRSATLREDWPEERAASEAWIRRWVQEHDAAGRRVLVVPMRLSGFGPYAEVLADLTYAAGDGLLPHAAMGDWLRATASRVSCEAGWGSLGVPCPAVVHPDR